MELRPESPMDPAGRESAIPAELVEDCYSELRRIAYRALSTWEPEQSLQATALVHEAWLRMARLERFEDLGRPAFLAFAALNIRRILIESYRARGRERRGGHLSIVPLFDSIALEVGPAVGLVALDAALEHLGHVDARAAQVVELRFFGGLGESETADVLGVSPRTVSKLWRYAKSWLAERLEGGS